MKGLIRIHRIEKPLVFMRFDVVVELFFLSVAEVRKLSIAQIELRRTKTVQKIRAEISNSLIEAESAKRKRLQSKMLYDAQSSLIAVLEISYTGELSTERMMPVWEKLDYCKIEIQTAEIERETIRTK